MRSIKLKNIPAGQSIVRLAKIMFSGLKARGLHSADSYTLRVG